MEHRTLIRGNHASREFLTRMFELRQEGVLVDVELLPDTGDKGIKAHRLLLAACSSYFHTRFSHWDRDDASTTTTTDVGLDQNANPAKKAIKKVRVGGVNYPELKLLVDYMYKAEIEVSADSAPAIMAAADLLLMDKVKAAVCDFLQKLICPANCIYLNRLADTFVCPNLLESSKLFIQRNFEDVCRTEDFLELRAEEVEDFISMDNLYVTEETVVEVVLSWWCASQNDESRSKKASLRRLFSHVKLDNLSLDYLRKLQDDQRLKMDSETLELIQGHCEKLNSSEADGGPSAVVSTSRARGLNKFIVAIGFDSSNAEYLDLDQPEAGWTILSQIPEMRYGLSGAGLATYGDLLLVTGGVGRGGVLKALNRFLIYNVRTNQWLEGPAMLTARKCHASVVVDGRLYVMGGSDSQVSVLTAESLDLTQTEDQWTWEAISPLPSWHNGSFAPVVGHNIYLPVAYGTDNDKLYDTTRGLWLGWDDTGGNPDATRRLERDRPGVGQLGDHVYLVGGAGTRELMSAVERWDGQTWRQVASLNHPREGPGVVSYAGKLYAIGGRGADGTVERYHPEEDRWEVLPEKVGCDRQEYSAVILDRLG